MNLDQLSGREGGKALFSRAPAGDSLAEAVNIPRTLISADLGGGVLPSLALPLSLPER